MYQIRGGIINQININFVFIFRTDGVLLSSFILNYPQVECGY